MVRFGSQNSKLSITSFNIRINIRNSNLLLIFDHVFSLDRQGIALELMFSINTVLMFIKGESFILRNVKNTVGLTPFTVSAQTVSITSIVHSLQQRFSLTKLNPTVTQLCIDPQEMALNEKTSDIANEL
jgi:hypothetical protein